MPAMGWDKPLCTLDRSFTLLGTANGPLSPVTEAKPVAVSPLPSLASDVPSVRGMNPTEATRERQDGTELAAFLHLFVPPSSLRFSHYRSPLARYERSEAEGGAVSE